MHATNDTHTLQTQHQTRTQTTQTRNRCRTQTLPMIKATKKTIRKANPNANHVQIPRAKKKHRRAKTTKIEMRANVDHRDSPERSSRMFSQPVTCRQSGIRCKKFAFSLFSGRRTRSDVLQSRFQKGAWSHATIATEVRFCICENSVAVVGSHRPDLCHLNTLALGSASNLLARVFGMGLKRETRIQNQA